MLTSLAQSSSQKVSSNIFSESDHKKREIKRIKKQKKIDSSFFKPNKFGFDNIEMGNVSKIGKLTPVYQQRKLAKHFNSWLKSKISTDIKLDKSVHTLLKESRKRPLSKAT